MSFHVLIPARMASSRLPRKPLADLCGLPMVVRVAQRAALSAAQQVVVAADDEQIVQACTRHGVRAVLTRNDHPSGSDRLAEACELLGLDGDERVVNVQGDEPLIPPSLINSCAHMLQLRSDCVVATAAHPIESDSEFANPNVVKVVLDREGRALYFSRAPIPCWRDAPRRESQYPSGAITSIAPINAPALRHIGIYAYRAGFLRQFPKLEVAPIEQSECLEQLRIQWHGYRIAVHVAAESPGTGVDTPEDLERVRAALAQGN